MGLLGKALSGIGIIILLALVGYAVFTGTNSNSPAMKNGEMAPDFTLPSVDGGTFTLSDYRGKENILLYFQEGIMCPACWDQQVGIEKQVADFKALNVKVVMITVDPPNLLYQTKKQYMLKEELLYDNTLKVSNTYGVLKDSMHPWERPGHVFVLVDKEGRVQWYYSAYKPTGQDSHGHPSGGTMYVPVDSILVSVRAALSNGVSI